MTPDIPTLTDAELAADAQAATGFAIEAARARWRTSCHESGHILAALRFGWSVGYACVFDDALGGGIAALNIPDGASGCSYRRAFCAMAGPAAEELVIDIVDIIDIESLAMPAAEAEDIAEQCDAERYRFSDLHEETQAVVVADNLEAERDIETVRTYCLASPDWREWSLRAAGLHRQCLAMLEEHRPLWTAIARLLYADGLIVNSQIVRLVREHSPGLLVQEEDIV